MPDNLIYPRFEKIADEVDEFGKFKSVISMDLSVSRNMPLEVQKFNMLMNALYTTYLASEGIKKTLVCTGDLINHRFSIIFPSFLQKQPGI